MLSKFIGGPFNEGHREALLDQLGIRPSTCVEDYLLTDADFERIKPRHFPLSIPSDPIPGFPKARRRTH